MLSSSRKHKKLSLPFRPRLEILEDRTLLSDCTVSLLTDTGEKGDLRYCITQAADGDTVSFKVTGTINLTKALPDLTHSISIEGPGADLLTVRRDAGGDYRIFTIANDTTVGIAGVSIADGRLGVGIGGGIANSGTLTVSGADVSGNYAGAYGGGIWNTGTLTLVGSFVRGNFATIGGGIYNAGILSVSGSAISDNLEGGIYNARAGLVDVTDSTVSGNHVSGGISNYGTMTLTGSGVSDNTSNGNAGGIRNFDTLTIATCVISGNFAASYGGGIVNSGRLTVTNSALSGNSAYRGGGGIYNASTMTITNSTLSGNSTEEIGSGGGIANSGTLSVTFSMLSGNSAEVGGGISSLSGTMTMRNTIVAGNTAVSFPDLSGGLDSRGYNLIGNTNGGSGFDASDLLNVDPVLGSLQDNGGPTQTMALQCGSPAIDAGDNTDAPEWDQRGEGFPRIVNKIIDIGAYEVQKGECGGLAPHSSDRLNRLIPIALALDSPLGPISRVANVRLSADLEVKPIPPVSQSVAATPTPSERITRPLTSLGMAEDSLFLDPNLDAVLRNS
jgi:hypothetical protein